MADLHPITGRTDNPENAVKFFGEAPADDNLPEQNGHVLVFPPSPQKPRGWQLWRARLFLLIFVLFCLEIGIIVTVAPWTPFWANNLLLGRFPQLREFLMNDFVRGMISGLGIADIWLAVSEAVYYRESAN